MNMNQTEKGKDQQYVFKVQLNKKKKKKKKKHSWENVTQYKKIPDQLYFYHDLWVMSLDTFNLLTITVTPQSVLWKYTIWFKAHLTVFKPDKVYLHCVNSSTQCCAQ